MVAVLLGLLLACGAPAPTGLPLPAPYADLVLPTEGASIKKQEGAELVLDYPGLDVKATLSRWSSSLKREGWTLTDPEPGPGFTRLIATRGKGQLEIFVVKQKDRTEVHLELMDPSAP